MMLSTFVHAYDFHLFRLSASATVGDYYVLSSASFMVVFALRMVTDW